MRLGTLETILLNMVCDLTMKQAQEFSTQDPTLSRDQLVSRMIQQAYDRLSPEAIRDVMSLKYDETVYLELKLKMYALKGLRYYEDFSQLFNAG